jgi:hypothetical protein
MLPLLPEHLESLTVGVSFHPERRGLTAIDNSATLDLSTQIEASISQSPVRISSLSPLILWNSRKLALN